MAARGSKDAHLAAALALLDEQGPSDVHQLFTVQGLAETLGVHRSTLYRHWPTSADLNDDLTRWSAIERPGWQGRFVARDPAAPLEESVASALGEITGELSIALRASVLGFPYRASTDDVIAWERAWLDLLAWWVDQHLWATGRRPRGQLRAFDIGLAIACTVEGQLVLGALHGGPLLDGWKPDHSELIAATAARTVEQMTVPGPAPRTDDDRPPLPRVEGWPGAKTALAQRLADLTSDAPFGSARLPEVSRIVDFRALSLRTGVSTRRLYALWPAAESFNADLVELVTIRHRDDGEVRAAEALATALRRPGADVDDLMAATAEAIVLGGSEGGRSSPFACVAAMAHPIPRQRGSAIIDESMRRQQVAVLAMLHTFGFDIHPSLDVDRFVRVLYGTITGCQRVALSHPDLRERRVDRSSGGSTLALAVALGQVLRACTVRRPSPSGGAATEAAP